MALVYLGFGGVRRVPGGDGMSPCFFCFAVCTFAFGGVELCGKTL